MKINKPIFITGLSLVIIGSAIMLYCFIQINSAFIPLDTSNIAIYANATNAIMKTWTTNYMWLTLFSGIPIIIGAGLSIIGYFGEESLC